MMNFYDILFCRYLCKRKGGSKPTGTLDIHEEGLYDVANYAYANVNLLITYRTVLYTDGTFIINESSRDQAANIQAHGEPTNIYVPFDPNGATDVDKYIFINPTVRPWYSETSAITRVEIGSNISPTDMYNWFADLSNCTSMELSKLDTSNVTNMFQLFFSCSSLRSLDLSNFDTSNVTDMGYMFSFCESLISLDLSNFDTSKVAYMLDMFESCEALIYLDVSSFNTSNVNNMRNMFLNCKALTSLDLSSFNTSNVTDMSGMFDFCESLTSLDLSSFNTSNVTEMSGMFAACKCLTSLDVSNFDTSNVTNMNSMFSMCDKLVTLDISSFDTGSVTNMNRMFWYSGVLKTVYASVNFVTAQVTTSYLIFEGAYSIQGGAGTTYYGVDITYAHIDGGTSNPGYFTAKS